MSTSSDGVPYVLHGPRVDATTDGSGAPAAGDCMLEGALRPSKGLECLPGTMLEGDATTDGSGVCAGDCVLENALRPSKVWGCQVWGALPPFGRRVY